MSWPNGLTANLGISALVVLLLMAGGAAVAAWLRGGRHDGVDVLWGASFGVVAVVTLIASSGYGDGWRRWLVTVLTVLWGTRLAWHIGRRNHGKPEDPRYRTLLAKAPGNPNLYALRTIYLLQGVLIWLISLPVQLAQYSHGDTLLGGTELASWVGVALWLIGMVFESVGDAQLARFRADPATNGQVMNRGLWRYTRHPNYFGDACVWWGLTLLAFHYPVGIIALLSAAAMTFLLTRGSGARLLESTISQRRPGYADYISRTSGFFPLPPRRTG